MRTRTGMMTMNGGEGVQRSLASLVPEWVVPIRHNTGGGNYDADSSVEASSSSDGLKNRPYVEPDEDDMARIEKFFDEESTESEKRCGIRLN